MRARSLPSEAILEIGWCMPRRKSNYMKCVIKVISFEWGGISTQLEELQSNIVSILVQF